MLRFAWKWFGLKKLKALLDKLPANGKKTYISALITLLSVAASFLPEYSELIHITIKYLQEAFDANPAATTATVAGAISTMTGLLHKVLKVSDKALEGLEKK